MKGRIKRIFLYFIAAFIWGVPGFILTMKGVRAYSMLPAQKLLWAAYRFVCNGIKQ